MRKILSILCIIVCICLFVVILSACGEKPKTDTADNYEKVEIDDNNNKNTSENENNSFYNQTFSIYSLAKTSGFTGSYEEWLSSIQGDSIQLQVANGYLQWKYSLSSEWINLLNISDLQGRDGIDGKDGTNGIDGINGKDGKDGKDGTDGTNGKDGIDGVNGTDGKDGNSLLTGISEPENTIGKNGDSYLDTQTWNFYIKSNDLWELVGNIKANNDIQQTLCFQLLDDGTYGVVGAPSGNIKNIIIPEKYNNIDVTTILDGAFESFSAVESIEIPNTITSIGNYAFSGCNSLQNIIFPGSILTIGSYAFEDCFGLTNIILPSNITDIDEFAFKNCTNITDIEIYNMKDMYDSIFNGCSNITNMTIEFPTGSKGAIGILFGKSKYNNAIAVGQYYNSDNSYNTTSYYIPNTLKNIHVIGKIIGYSAFYNCTMIENIIIEDTIQQIKGASFNNCSNLKSIKIPNNIFLKNIPSGLLNGCGKLEKITLPFVGLSTDSSTSSSLKLFGAIFGGVSYNGAEAIEQYYGTCKITYYIPSSLKEITINGGEIYDEAFRNCNMLTNIILNNDVTNIGAGAFRDCINLKNIILGTNITSIKSALFDGCFNLINIVIPNSVINIENYAFYRCSKLIYIKIPDSVKSIGSYAFGFCFDIDKVIIPDNSINIATDAFYDCMDIKFYYEGEEEKSPNIYKHKIWYYLTPNKENETQSGNWWYYDDDGNIVEKVVE